MIATLAEAKAVAELAKAGNPPGRTVIYAAWDAEEPGLIGSTEWAEHHAEDLKEHAVAYLNNNDSYHYFEKLDEMARTKSDETAVTTLIKPGSTGTNVNDLVIILTYQQ